ncbi:MAG: ABC transporter permease subunit [Eubacteriaceae bacterium]|nr:ABC transporter permease subunit [Eubacteriaceae bacterium]
MNIYIKEMKGQIKTLIFWTIGIFAMIFGGMSKYGAMYSGSGGDSINQLMESIPKTIRIVLGFIDLDLSTVEGFYGVLFGYVILMAAVHGAMLGANIISKEENLKTVEFLMAKPVSRADIIRAKILAGVTGIFIFNLVTLGTSIFSVNFYGGDSSADRFVMNVTLGLFISQAIFFFIGTAVASNIKRPKISTAATMGIVMFMYLISIVLELSDKLNFLRFITPFKYFVIIRFIENKGFDLSFLMVSFLIIAILKIVTFKAYEKRDLYI